MIRHVILPGALPQVLVGLRQSLGVAWLALVVAEQVNANAGLGFIISQATQFLRNDVILVALAVYAVLGLLTDALVRLLGEEGTGMAPRTPAPVGIPAVRVRGLTRDFDGRRILDGLDLDIAPGEFVALLGVSGTGKSTLLRAVAGLDREVTGELDVAGPVAIAFQEPRLLPWRRVLADVALGLRAPDAAALALTAPAEVGLTDRARAWPVGDPVRRRGPAGRAGPGAGAQARPAAARRAVQRARRVDQDDHAPPGAAAVAAPPVLSPPCCWSPTTWTRRSYSPTACSSWPTAASPSASRWPSLAPGTATIPRSSSSGTSCSASSVSLRRQ